MVEFLLMFLISYIVSLGNPKSSIGANSQVLKIIK